MFSSLTDCGCSFPSSFIGDWCKVVLYAIMFDASEWTFPSQNDVEWKSPGKTSILRLRIYRRKMGMWQNGIDVWLLFLDYLFRFRASFYRRVSAVRNDWPTNVKKEGKIVFSFIWMWKFNEVIQEDSMYQWCDSGELSTINPVEHLRMRDKAKLVELMKAFNDKKWSKMECIAYGWWHYWWRYFGHWRDDRKQWILWRNFFCMLL